MSDDAHQEHDFVLSVLIPVTAAELKRFEKHERLVFRKLDPRDASQVRGAGVFCTVCQIPLEAMGWGEREHCRGEVAEIE